jgi:ribosome modulation factor
MMRIKEAQANMAYYGFKRVPEEDFSDDGTRFFMWVWDPENTGHSPFLFSKAGGYGEVFFSKQIRYGSDLYNEIRKRGYHLDDLNGVSKEHFTDEALGKIVAQLQEIRQSDWFEAICPEFSTRGAIDAGVEVKDYNADKDHQRVMDIAKRANSDPEKMAKLAANMAKAISDKEKMRSRWQAAIDVYGSESPVAKAFEDQVRERGWRISIGPRSGDIDWSSLFESTIRENVKDESIYNAHAEYEKDQLKKKEEEDNQENFTFDEGSVKLATVVKESAERKYWNNFFDKLTESEEPNYFSEGFNAFNRGIKKCPYEQGTEAFESWVDGWQDAQMEYEEYCGDCLDESTDNSIKESKERKHWDSFFDKLTESTDNDIAALKEYFDTEDVEPSDETCWGLPAYVVNGSETYAVGHSDECYEAAVRQAISIFEDDTDEGKINWLQKWNWPGVDEEGVCEACGDDPDDYEEGETIYQPSSISEYLDTMGFSQASDAFSWDFLRTYVNKYEVGEFVVDYDGIASGLASYDGKEIELPNGLYAYRFR